MTLQSGQKFLSTRRSMVGSCSKPMFFAGSGLAENLRLALFVDGEQGWVNSPLGIALTNSGQDRNYSLYGRDDLKVTSWGVSTDQEQFYKENILVGLQYWLLLEMAIQLYKEG